MSLIRRAQYWLASLFLLGCLMSNAIAGDLIYLNSTAGTNLLLKADFNKQFFSVMPYVTTEEIETFCGAASIASVLNSLPTKNRPVVPQFTPYHYVWAANPTVYYGSSLSLSQFRNLISSSLSNPNQRLIVNFDRKALGQIGHGHFSPIGAYDSKTDSVLILDVAKYKYPPVWAKTSDLFAAIQGIDTTSGKSRGLAQITIQ